MRCPVVCIGGGAGMAPILSLIRRMNQAENTRPVRFYCAVHGTAVRACSLLDEIQQIGKGLTELPVHRLPVRVRRRDDPRLGDRRGRRLVTDVVARHEDNIAKTEVYLCGPPPMVDAALAFLDSSSVPKDQVFYDSFTSPLFN